LLDQGDDAFEQDGVADMGRMVRRQAWLDNGGIEPKLVNASSRCVNRPVLPRRLP
jgi:hypothetical protein